jgi:hypothetical protein
MTTGVAGLAFMFVGESTKLQSLDRRFVFGSDLKRESALNRYSLMEEWMPRHFGLKATSVIERAGSTRVSGPIPALAAPTAPSPSLSLDDTPESKVSSPGLALPFSPASWRGCHGRRSISAH